MKLFVSAIAFAAGANSEGIFSEETHNAFQSFKLQFSKVYASEVKEREALAVFASNLVKAEERNLMGGAQHGITKFMDLTPEEFKSQYRNYIPTRRGEKRVLQNHEELPKAAFGIDWRNTSLPYNVLTPVKNQGRCGSCWAFSATEQMESVYAMANNVDAREFSTQQVVACDPMGNGCGGGDTVSAFKYIKSAGGLELAKAYPDTSSSGGRSGECKVDKSQVVPGTRVSETIFCIDECYGQCKMSSTETEKAKQCITAAPQSICVDASPWQTYTSGVMTTNECGSNSAYLDHCVQVVGYEHTSDGGYYIVRNSWGSDWGYAGTIRLSMNGNTCGILDEMTTVTLE